MTSKAADRLRLASNHLNSTTNDSKIRTLDPNNNSFPKFKELPQIPGAPEGAAWFWGKDDNLGRINLLTASRVKAASAEIENGEMIPVNLPLDVPRVPGFGRPPFQHQKVDLGGGLGFDDIYTMNTQSSTQWDGFRHVAHPKSATFYNGVSSEDIKGPHANDKNSISYIAEHGIAGRGILLDFVRYAEDRGIEYDPFEHYEISFDALQDCARSQGLDPRPRSEGGDLRPGDLLFIRSGWVKAYSASTQERRETVARRKKQAYAGVSQVGGTLEWLHDCYFATVAGDAPAFEAWPSKHGFYLHEYLLALWGVPIGEMVDLERLSQRCAELKRWTFFFTSAPANCPEGVASHVNGLAFL